MAGTKEPRAVPLAGVAPPPLLCAVPPDIAPPAPPPGVGGLRLRAIVSTSDKWGNGTVLHYYFLDRSAALRAQMDVVRKAFQHWKAQGIGLNFAEVNNAAAAEIRVTFRDTGSWSYVGRSNLKIKDTKKATMNFGWDLRTEWGWATALHETGHALGLPHEHQNPKAGIEWNRAQVYATFGGPPNNWKKATIDRNVIEKLPSASVEGTDWDPRSIMHYPFSRGLILKPAPYDVQGTPRNMRLSRGDIAVVRYFYPGGKPQLRAMRPGTAALPTKIGGQANFVIEPDETRTYTLRAKGADATLVLFEEYRGEPVYLSGDDNAGTGKPAEIEMKLHQGRRYIARVRTAYARGKPTLSLA